jgi:hypothetical protein
LIYSPDQLLKLIHDSKALSIWDRNKGPVFWYIAGVPGPFYINTEQMLGERLAQELLRTIDTILASTGADNPAARAVQLNKAILAVYQSDPVYQNIVATMVAKAKQEFPLQNCRFISGGERRDWLFSIPFAKESGLKHVFIFKDRTVYCEQALKPLEAGLHVCDLINNAASHFEIWFPALEKVHLQCVGTVCVNSRGINGVQKLDAQGQKVVALSHIDLAFFKQSLESGLIDQPAYEEIACHFTSPKEWATRYLLNDVSVFDIEHIDKKSFERLRSFVANDPWSLRKDHEAFLAILQKKIDERLKSQAA